MKNAVQTKFYQINPWILFIWFYAISFKVCFHILTKSLAPFENRIPMKDNHKNYSAVKIIVDEKIVVFFFCLQKTFSFIFRKRSITAFQNRLDASIYKCFERKIQYTTPAVGRLFDKHIFAKVCLFKKFMEWQRQEIVLLIWHWQTTHFYLTYHRWPFQI